MNLVKKHLKVVLFQSQGTYVMFVRRVSRIEKAEIAMNCNSTSPDPLPVVLRFFTRFIMRDQRIKFYVSRIATLIFDLGSLLSKCQEIKLCRLPVAKSNNPRPSCDFNVQLGDVCHLGFDRKWIFTIPRPPVS